MSGVMKFAACPLLVQRLGDHDALILRLRMGHWVCKPIVDDERFPNVKFLSLQLAKDSWSMTYAQIGLCTFFEQGRIVTVVMGGYRIGTIQFHDEPAPSWTTQPCHF